jgi:hypothetical protein
VRHIHRFGVLQRLLRRPVCTRGGVREGVLRTCPRCGASAENGRYVLYAAYAQWPQAASWTPEAYIEAQRTDATNGSEDA